MNRNNHSPRSDAETLRQVDGLMNEGQASGDPVLDNLRVHIPRADAARAQALEDELAAMWEAGTRDDLIASHDSAKPYMNRAAQPNRAGRLPYLATLAAMIALVAAVVLLNRPSPPGTASQTVVTTRPVMPTATFVPVVSMTPETDATATYLVGQATQIQAENIAATQISQPTQPPASPAENCYIVQPDDTIESIARENGITAEQILQSNAEIAQAVETDDGIVYRIWLSPGSCLRLSPPNPVPGGLVSIIAPYSLLVPRNDDQPARLEVGETISLYVAIAAFTTWGEPKAFDTVELRLLAANVQVMAILDYASEYVISIPQAIRPVITWLWQDSNQHKLVYEVE